MPAFKQQEESPYSPRQLFEMVKDVTRYPEFLPWCKAVRILGPQPDGFDAEMIVRFKQFTESYVSRVTLHPPASDHEACAIEVDMIKGPFHHLDNHWRFEPLPGGGTNICLDLDFRFRSPILEGLIGIFFERAAATMTHSFKERADALYGKPAA